MFNTEIKVLILMLTLRLSLGKSVSLLFSFIIISISNYSLRFLLLLHFYSLINSEFIVTILVRTSVSNIVYSGVVNEKQSEDITLSKLVNAKKTRTVNNHNKWK